MKPTSVPVLVGLGVLATAFGATLCNLIAGRGHPIPVTGWVSGLVLLVIAAVLLATGIPLRRYMKESAERHENPTLAPRRHQIDLPTAYRTVVFACACAYTGAVAGGFFAGEALFLLSSGTGSFAGALLPTLFATAAGLVLAALGVIVERWGRLPPSDGEEGAQSPAA